MAHRHNDNLAGEHRLGDLGQFLFFCLFGGIWISDFILGYSNFINDSFPPAVRLPIGIIILLISLYMAYAGLQTVFGKNTRTDEVIRKGVFRYLRHPIYVSEFLLYIGLVFINFSLAAVISLLPIIAFLYFLCRYEEKLLVAKYGDEYRRYMQETRMWFPKIIK